ANGAPGARLEERFGKGWAKTWCPTAGDRRSAPVGGGLELLDRHEDGSGLGTLRRTDHAAALHEVHEPAGTGEPDPELALEHGGGAEPAADHQLDGLAE